MDSVENNFKKSFKYYKRRNPPPNFDNVIDASKIEHKSYFQHVVKHNGESESPLPSLCNPRSYWRILQSKQNPGFFIILNVFNQSHSLYWIRQCLMQYTSSKYKRNIDAHFQIDSWFNDAQNPQQKQLVDKLRWSTLGYHHNWDTKEYDQNVRSDFPSDLDTLCKYIATTLQYPTYKAEAAIVNFYPGSSTLSAHTDHSEHNLTAPLISISFGQPAIFLVGGKTLDVTPSPYLLSDGSIAVMTKDVRLCYHAVPKIIIDPDQNFQYFKHHATKEKSSQKSKTIRNGENVDSYKSDKRKIDEISSDYPEKMARNEHKKKDDQKIDEIFCEESENIYKTEKCNDNESLDDEDMNFIVDYLKTHRINLNIRQVNFYS